MSGAKSNIALIGSGGVGSVAALALEQSGKATVTMIIRSLYDHVCDKGLTFDSCDYGHVHNWKPHHIAKDVEGAAKYGPFDYVVVSTKYIPEVQSTAELVRPLVAKGTTIVLVQNGLGNEEPVMEAFPDSYVIGGVSMIGSTNYEGKILHVGHDKIGFGTLDKRPEAEKALHNLIDIYNQCGKSEAYLLEDLTYRRWCKLIYNAAYNTVAALTNLDTGRLFFSGVDTSVVLPAMYEVRSIAEADMGKKLPENIEQEMLDSDNGLYYKPSMMVDVIKGQVMELEPILGNPLKVARRTGTPAPVLTLIYNLLKGKQYALLESKGLVKVPESYSRFTDADKVHKWSI